MAKGRKGRWSTTIDSRPDLTLSLLTYTHTPTSTHTHIHAYTPILAHTGGLDAEEL